jgi:pimeloyl-ACP methyl ester carboxylesterase
LDGVAAMSAPVTLGRLDAVLVALPALRQVVRWWHPLRDADLDNPAARAEIAGRFAAGRPGVDDPAALARMRASVRVSTRAIDQFGRVMRLVRRELHMVRAPLLVVQGCRDEWVPAECPSQIFAGAGSRDKELVWFEYSSHALLSGVERGVVMETVYRFISTHGGRGEETQRR